VSFKAEIPYGGYWSTPFARWQGALADLNAVVFAAFVGRKELERRAIEPAAFDYAVLGLTVPQHHSFFGLPWFSGLVGCGHIAGPTIMQACATGARVLLSAVQEVECGLATAALAVSCDRTSNGPHLYYPAPLGPGGTGEHEDWVLDNFSHDPLGPHSMLRTAENVAAKHGISTAEQHEIVPLREAQYRAALADGRAFQLRFMTLPFEVPDPKLRKTIATMEGDEGIRSSSAEGLARLRVECQIVPAHKEPARTPIITNRRAGRTGAL
jgi:acetyl-CoA acetyltransferase